MKDSVTVSELMSKAKGSDGLKERGYLEEALRERIREFIQELVEEELECALGCSRYQRGEPQRRGYRKGRRCRKLTTGCGVYEISVPRGAYFEPQEDGKREWNSKLLPRYQRRTAAIEEALVRTYLCGANTRKIKTALAPILEGAALSKSAVSRIITRLSEHYQAWRRRDLSGEDIAIIYLDGFNLKVRLAGRVEVIPTLCAVGVRSDGGKVLLVLEQRSSESEAAWAGVCEDLAARGVNRPVLAVIDGSRGLYKAVKSGWPWIEVQRCCKHKWENLKTHTPKRCWEELKADYDAIVYQAKDEVTARKAYRRFERKWSKRCPGVVSSLQEAGDELLTFYRYPRLMWKAIRTTNSIERVNCEFRRRTKTQGSFPNATAGVTLLFGLCACKIIKMRRITGHHLLTEVVRQKRKEHGLITEVDKVA